MDPTTIAAVVLLTIGLLGTDAVVHPASISVGFDVSANVEKDGPSKTAVESIFMEEIYRVAATKSVVAALTIKADREKSIAVAFAETVKLEDLVTSLQNKFGYRPDQMDVSLFSENSQLKVLISGDKKLASPFQEVVVQEPKESFVDLLRRAADVGASNIDPYITSLYLIQVHAVDKNFQDAVALISYARSELPRTLVNPDRARFDNLLGIIKLFLNDPKGAREFFETAIQSDPKGSVAIINAGFADIQLGDCQVASDRLAKMLHDAPPANPVLLMTAYMTLAAARLGLQDVVGADGLLAKAASAYPYSGPVFDLWSSARSQLGDSDGAAKLHRRAHENSADFENYAEVAALYFQLAWKNGGPVTRSIFSNPQVVSFH